MNELEPSLDHRRRYRLLSVLGSGGYGTVYLAELTGSAGFRKRVALKVARGDGLANRERARLLDEARMLALIRHRAIVAVENLINLDGLPAIVMEYVEGASLAAVVDQGPVPARAALEIVGELGQALDVALQSSGPDGRPLNLIHRDIKPSNVLITARGEIKLLDFGIAWADLAGRHAETTVGNLPGTYDYLAPERLDGREVGPPADVYALGALLYELLRGESLGLIRGSKARHARTLEGRMDLLGATLGREDPLLGLVESMLLFDPEQRPSAEDVARECSRLFDRAQGERLFTWSARVVPEVRRHERERPSDERTGLSYSEDTFRPETTGEDPEEPQEAPAPDPFEEPSGLGQVLLGVAPQQAPQRTGPVADPESQSTLPTPATAGYEEHTVEAAPRPAQRGPGPISPGPISAWTPRRLARWVGGISALLAAIGGVMTQLDAISRALLQQDAAPKQEIASATAPALPTTTGAKADEEIVTGPPPPPETGPSATGPKTTPATQKKEETRPAPSTIILSGDAARVVVRDAKGVEKPMAPGSNPVPAGRYTVYANFIELGDVPKTVDNIVIDAGQTVELDCTSANLDCRITR